ncbi:MAG: hypothetical protein ACT4O9_01790 [Blastocatellia bacterium]
MKKIITTFVMASFLAVMIPMFAGSATAQTRRYSNNSSRYATTYKKPSIYRRHRNLINIGIGTGAGALIGGLLGGKKGAAWGALAGGGSAAVYTYKINPKTKKYHRVYR